MDSPEQPKHSRLIAVLLAVLCILALASLGWGIVKSSSDSADLLRRAEEVALFLDRTDPYRDPDLTYPPSALPVFTVLIAPFGNDAALRLAWLGFNLLALAALCWSVLETWGRGWPRWLVIAVALALAASRPARAGIALGQFHLIPTALMMISLMFIQAKRPIAAGVLVGVASIKPTMTLPFLGFLLIRGQGRALASAAAVQIGLFAGTCIWLGASPERLIREWLQLAREQSGSGTIDIPTAVLAVWPEANGLALAAGAAALAVILALMWRQREQSAARLACLSLYAACIFTYHRHYDLVLMLPALGYFVEDARAMAASPTWRRWLPAVLFGAGMIATSPLRAWEPAFNAVFAVFAYGFLALLARPDRSAAPGAMLTSS